MKNYLLSLFALAVMATASAQMTDGAKARVYAYGLTQSGDDVVTVSFKTNVAATSAKVLLSAEDYDGFEVEATSADGKNWTAVINPSGDFVADVKYNWSVEVSAPAVTEWTRISDNESTSNFSFFRSYGIAVDKAPESSNFGRVYVANNKAGETTNASTNGSINRETAVGIYTYTPNLIAENNAAAYSCSVVGDGSTSGASPKDMVVGPDGNIYLTVHEKNKSGVFVVNPTNFTSSAIFEGTRDESTGHIKDADENIVVGNPYAIGVYGTGEDRTLYIIDEHGIGGGMDNLSLYEIGTDATWSTVPTRSNHEYSYIVSGSSKNVRVYSTNCAVEPIKTGGCWISYYYNGGGKVNIPTLIYIDENDVCKFNFEGEGLASTGNGRQGALAVHEASGTVAYSDGANAVFLNYKVNDDNSITVDKESLKSYTKDMQGSYSNGFDFDYAGNLYAVTSGAELMAVFAVPDAIMGENTRVTPAKKSLTIAYTQGQIEATGVETIGVDNAPVEYYNLQGVKVENPENGIFIKKQGNKAVKVIL